MRLRGGSLNLRANFRDLLRHDHFEDAAARFLRIKKYLPQLSGKMHVVRMPDPDLVSARECEFDRKYPWIRKECAEIFHESSQFQLRRLPHPLQGHDLIRVHDERKGSFVRIDDQIPRVWVHVGVVGMRQQVFLSGRKRDFGREIDGATEQSIQ
jgi:hypothetical protein